MLMGLQLPFSLAVLVGKARARGSLPARHQKKAVRPQCESSSSSSLPRSEASRSRSAGRISVRFLSRGVALPCRHLVRVRHPVPSVLLCPTRSSNPAQCWCRTSPGAYRRRALEQLPARFVVASLCLLRRQSWVLEVLTALRLLLLIGLLANIQEVAIRWNLPLKLVVQKLAGTEPVYIHERSRGFVQARVRFSVPLCNDKSIIEQVEASGIPCHEVWEAESTAAVSALSQLQHGPFHARVFDVSRLQCDEMEKSYQQHMLKGGEVFHGIKLLLLDWEDCMVKIESCYRGFYEEVVESMRCGYDGTNAKISSDAGNCLYELNKASYIQFTKLTVESEKMRGEQQDVQARADRHFRSRSHYRPQIRQTDFPCEIKLCMKVVLDEVMSSLGWDAPSFSVSSAEVNVHSCEVLLLAKSNVGDGNGRTILIAGGEGSSEDEAVENACQRALLLLEAETSILLLDANYSQRCHAEIYVSEAKEVEKLAISIGANILTEWERLIDGLQACKECNSSMVAEHPVKEPGNQLYNAKCECSALVGDLHGECVSDLVLAKERHTLLSDWTNQ